MSGPLRVHAIRGDAASLIGTGAAIVLSILALAGVEPKTLTPIATMCLGAAIIGHGTFVAKRLIEGPIGMMRTASSAMIGETAGNEILGGTATVVLGALALGGFAPTLLLGVAAIVTGGCMLLSPSGRAKIIGDARLSKYFATTVLVVGGTASLVLGVIAVSGGGHPQTLLQVARLVLAVAVFVSAATGGAKLLHEERAEANGELPALERA